MDTSENKELFVDYTKGIAALLVVFCHTWAHTPMEDVQLFFWFTHVPAFYLMSGYLYSRYTIRRSSRYRVHKASSLLICFFIYCGILFATYLVIDLCSYLMTGVANLDFLEELILDIHRMWYFPVLFCGIMLYEMIMKMKKTGLMIASLVLCVGTGIALLFLAPSFGKPLIYITVFFAGTTIRFSKVTAIMAIAIDVFFWIVFVSILNTVSVESEAMRGGPLLLFELLLFAGSFFLPSICYLCQGTIAKMPLVSKALRYCGKNSQLFYFTHLWVIVVVEFFLKQRGIIEISFLQSLLYSVVGIVCSVLLVFLTKKNAVMRRVFLKPIK